MHFAARVIVFLSFLFLFLVFKSTPVFAQTPTPPPQNLSAQAGLHIYTQSVMIEVMSSLTCALAGIDIVDQSQKCLGIVNGKIGPVDSNKGAVGVLTNLVSMTFYIPAKTSDYVRYMAGNFGIAKSAYADNGIGFTGLSPLLKVWSAFRDITYLLFVLIFIIIGFAIMLRIHIDPRTVMTIENQIPKIIIGLILVTFSFAIAGFLIDLMYVFIYLVINVFASIDPAIDKQIAQATNTFQAANTLSGTGGIGGIAFNVGQTIGGFFGPVFDNAVGRFLMGGVFAAIGKFVGVDMVTGLISIITAPESGGLSLVLMPLAGKLLEAPLGVIIPGLFGLVGGIFAPQFAILLGIIIAFIVIIIAIIWALIRLWFTLLKAYIMILIDVVFAPFWVLMGILPGSRLSFEGWLRDLGSNLLAFPAVIVMFLLGKTFMDLFAGAKGGDFFVPPLIGNPVGTAMGNLIGLGFILLTPAAVDMMRKALKAPDLDLSTIFRAVGVGTGAVNPINALGRATQFGSTLYWGQQTPVLSGILNAMGIKPRGGSGPSPH